MGSWRDLYRTHWIVWGGLLLLSGMFQYLGWVDWLKFDRELLDDGHIPLLFSSQLVHLNWPHWVLNMAGMVMIAVLFGRYGSVCYWLWVLAVSAFSVGIGLWWLNPDLRWYVGLSGALHGLMLAGILQDMRIHRWSAIMLLVLVAGKLVWEQLAGAMPGSESIIKGRVVVDSHLYGAVGGLIAFVLWGIVNIRER